MSLGERLKKLRLDHGMTQMDLCARLNIEQSTLANYESNRRIPKAETLLNIASIFDVTTDYLLGIIPPIKGIKVPILGRVMAGIPIEAIENIEGYEEITPALASKGEYFALRVKGDSMAPVIMENDIVIVRKQQQVESGDIAIVLVNGDEATVKKVQLNDHGITLVAFNIGVYPPHFYSEKEITTLPVQIIGKVVEAKRSF